jgi:hypothetical protein
MGESNLILEESSFNIFIYPFSFNRNQYKGITNAISNAAWKTRSGETLIWQGDTFPHDDLQPHVSKYFTQTDHSIETARLWKMTQGALMSNAALGFGRHNVDWYVNSPQGRQKFWVDEVKLSLFRIGIGFLTFNVKPSSHLLTDWNDFIHYFRFVDGRRGVYINGEKRVGREGYLPFFPSVCRDQKSEKHTFLEIINSILIASGFESWKDVFVPGQLIPYICSFVNSVAGGEQIIEIANRLQNFFHSGQTLHLSEDDRRMSKTSILPYKKDQWFLFSMEGSAFLAYDPPNNNFFRNSFPGHLKDQYFLSFILALHQRFALANLLCEIAESWAIRAESTIIQENEREKAFQNIRDTFFLFNARGFFHQVMQKENHHRYYRTWQKIFQIEELQRDLNQKINDMYEYLMMVRSDRLQRLEEIERKNEELERKELEKRERAAEERSRLLERRLSAIAWIIGLPVILLTFQQAGIGVSLNIAIIFVLVGLVLGLLVYLAIQIFTEKKARSKKDDEGI